MLNPYLYAVKRQKLKISLRSKSVDFGGGGSLVYGFKKRMMVKKLGDGLGRVMIKRNLWDDLVYCEV